MANKKPKPAPYYKTNFGEMIQGDSKEVLQSFEDESVDLIVTSPPYGLLRKKEYGNEDAAKYVDWFQPFAKECHRVLKPTGSFVLNIGGSWKRGFPTRSLYHFKLLIRLVEDASYGPFHLAQEFYWWNPARLPTPAEWVTVRRIRVKDAVESIYWLSKTEFPKASNRRVLQPYSDAHKTLMEKGYTAKKRPSGHAISKKFGKNNRGAIAPNLLAMADATVSPGDHPDDDLKPDEIPANLLAIANTSSNDRYQKYCREQGLTEHPARFPAALPEHFIHMLTDPDDLVVDPFAGSCVTGEAAERLNRRWTCIELNEQYLAGGQGRFAGAIQDRQSDLFSSGRTYEIRAPRALPMDAVWAEPLAEDGGRDHHKRRKAKKLARGDSRDGG